MKPVKTERTNCILTSNDDNIDDLPITRIKFGDGIQGMESCWELSEEEKKKVLQTGKIYFLCTGNIHPPVLLKVDQT